MIEYLLKKWRHRRMAQKYGVCLTHLVLMRQEGFYDPHWICSKCQQENEAKNIHREKGNIKERMQACEQLRRERA